MAWILEGFTNHKALRGPPTVRAWLTIPRRESARCRGAIQMSMGRHTANHAERTEPACLSQAAQSESWHLACWVQGRRERQET